MIAARLRDSEGSRFESGSGWFLFFCMNFCFTKGGKGKEGIHISSFIIQREYIHRIIFDTTGTYMMAGETFYVNKNLNSLTLSTPVVT